MAIYKYSTKQICQSIHNNRFFIILLFIDFLLVIGKILYISFGNIDLHTEEAQYWLWSKYPAWSYYSKPPLVAWVNYITTHLFGDTELAIKSGALFAGFILPIVVYVITKEWFHSSRMALYSGVILMVMPYFTYVTLFFTTDTYLLFFWLLSIYFTWKAFSTDRLKYWILSGFTFGLGFLSKYTMVLLIPIMFFFGTYRKMVLFKKPKFYLFIIILFIFGIPELCWNWSHDFVSFKHLLDLSEIEKFHCHVDSVLSNIAEFVGGQVALFSPFFIPVFVEGLKKLKRERFSRSKIYIYYLISLWMGVMIIFSIFSPRGVNINWTLFSYVTLPIVMAYLIYHYGSLQKLIWTSTATLFVQIIILIPILLDYAGLGRIYPAEKDTLKRMVGWEELGESVNQFLPRNDKCFIFSDSYHLASQLSFYVEHKNRSFCINEGRRMNQFDLWPDVNQFADRGYNGIYVSKNPPSSKVISSFEEPGDFRIIPIQYRDKTVKKFHLYMLRNFKGYEEKEPNKY